MAEDERPRHRSRHRHTSWRLHRTLPRFSLAVVSALTQPDELLTLVQLMCITPVACAIVMGPFLGWRRAPMVTVEDPIGELRTLLHPYNEGQGKWRVPQPCAQ